MLELGTSLLECLKSNSYRINMNVPKTCIDLSTFCYPTDNQQTTRMNVLKDINIFKYWKRNKRTKQLLKTCGIFIRLLFSWQPSNREVTDAIRISDNLLNIVLFNVPMWFFLFVSHDIELRHYLLSNDEEIWIKVYMCVLVILLNIWFLFTNKRVTFALWHCGFLRKFRVIPRKVSWK